MTVFCDKCGTENKDNAKFCYECGRTLNLDDLPTELKALKAGMKIADRYEIIERIKAGGMGAVYKAMDKRLGKLCAVKELLNQSIDEAEQADAIMRFEREAKILSDLDHPNLPGVTDYFTVGNRYYLTMEFIEGEDLSGILRQFGNPGLPEEKVVEWSLQICDVLHYLHTRKPPVIYRDIKPSNIMISKADKRAVLIDFGIARVLEDEDEEAEPSTKTAIGTVGYMSPEQYRGKPEPRSDIYSLGATMYHLIRGSPPLPFTFPSLKKERPDVSDEINAVVMTAVRLKSQERFPSALEMKRALSGMITVQMPATEELDETDILIMQLKSGDKTLRIYATKSLGELKTVKAIPALIKVLEEEKDPVVRQSAVESLAFYGDKSKVKETLKKILQKETHPAIRGAAVKVIGNLKDEFFLHPLINALEDPSEEVRWRSIIALGNLKNRESLELLYRFLHDRSEIIREEASSAIDKIDPNYLSLWKEDKEKVKKKIETKKVFLIGGSILILLVLSLVLVKFISTGYKSQQAENYYDQGIKYINGKDPLLARKEFEKMLDISPDNAKAYYGLGLTYLGENPGKAIENFNKAIRLDDTFADPYFAMGNLYSSANDFDKVIIAMEKAIELAPDNPYGYFFLGQAYYKKDDYPKAGEFFEICASRFPDSELGIKAKKLLEKMELESSNYYENVEEERLLKQGESYLSKQNYTEAVNCFKEVLVVNPSNFKAYYGLGMCYYDTDKETAKNNFFRALDLEPDYHRSSYALACLSFEQDNFPDTIKYSEMTLQKGGDYEELYVILGISYYNTGDSEKALESFNTYLSSYPEGTRVEDVQGMIKQINSGN